MPAPPSAPPALSRLLDLSGRVALVTGASSGLGAAIAARLAEAGATTVLHYRNNRDSAAAVAERIRARGGAAEPAHADIETTESAQELVAGIVARHGRLDVLVNNAGAYPVTPLLDMTTEAWAEVFRANAQTTFACTRAAAAAMIRAGSGAVVNVASISASSPAPSQAHYNSSKAAVLAFTRSAAQELGPAGIRVNAVSPGLVHRPGIETQWPDGVARWTSRAPLGRLGDPFDVADACLFLASDAARWITGQELVVDGGMLAASAY